MAAKTYKKNTEDFKKEITNPSYRKEAAPHGDHTHHFHAR